MRRWHAWVPGGPFARVQGWPGLAAPGALYPGGPKQVRVGLKCTGLRDNSALKSVLLQSIAFQQIKHH
jgi:hypothetical protein